MSSELQPMAAAAEGAIDPDSHSRRELLARAHREQIGDTERARGRAIIEACR